MVDDRDKEIGSTRGDASFFRTDVWRLRTQTIHFGELPAVMGIVNVTPDSFSDGGNFFDHSRAIEHGLQLAKQGAAILDVGGESTRPDAEPVSEQEELRRVIPVVEKLVEQTEIPVSIDTSKAKVAAEAVAAGARLRPACARARGTRARGSSTTCCC